MVDYPHVPSFVALTKSLETLQASVADVMADYTAAMSASASDHPIDKRAALGARIDALAFARELDRIRAGYDENHGPVPDSDSEADHLAHAAAGIASDVAHLAARYGSDEHTQVGNDGRRFPDVPLELTVTKYVADLHKVLLDHSGRRMRALEEDRRWLSGAKG